MTDTGPLVVPAPLQASVTIPAGSAVSGAVDVTGGRLVYIIMPSGWDDTTNAYLGMQASPDGVAWHTVIGQDSREVAMRVVPNAIFVLPDYVGRLAAWIRFTSGTDVQSADRVIGVAISTA